MSDPAAVLAAAAGEPAPTSQPPAPAPAVAVVPAQPAAAPPAAPGPIPYDRFKEVNDEKAQLAARLQELETAESERQRAAMSEADRLKADAEKWQGAATTNEQRAVTAERNLDVWKHAHQANFRHPDDAVLFLSQRIGELDSPEKIQEAISKLAEDRPDLLGGATPARPAPVGSLTGQPPAAQAPPTGPDGQVDVRQGLGRDLLAHLTGRGN